MQKTLSWLITAPLRRTGMAYKKVMYTLFTALKDIWTDFGSPCPRLVRFVRHRIFRSLPPAALQENTKPKQPPAKTKNSSPVQIKTNVQTPHLNAPTPVLISDTTAVVLYTGNGNVRQTIESIIAQSLPPEDVVISTISPDTEIQSIANEYSPPLKIIHTSQTDALSALQEIAEQIDTLHMFFICAGEQIRPDALRLAFSALQLNPSRNAAMFAKQNSLAPKLTEEIDSNVLKASCALLRRRAVIRQPVPTP